VAHVRRRGASRFTTVAAIVTSVTALAAVLVALWSGGSFNALICGGDCGSEAVSTPDALHLDPVAGSTSVSHEPRGIVDADAVRAAIAEALESDDLGERVGFAAADAVTGEVVATDGVVGRAFTPASTTKVMTALAVLSTVDPQHRFTTSVVRNGNDLVLVGGGDPYLASELPTTPVLGIEADLTTLARRTAAALERVGITDVRLSYDASLFSGPAVSPAWEKSYVTERIVTPVTALWVDQRGIADGEESDEPAALAAEEFAEQLDDAGISVEGDATEGRAPAGSTPLASVRSATVARITEHMVASSDNEAAEVLLRQAAIGAGRPGSFSDGVAVVRNVAEAQGIDTTGLVLNDGSGLSRKNRISPSTLAQTIAKAASNERTAGLISDLPTAYFSGTLGRRFGKADAGRGVVHAKTGTLSGVHSLAGYVQDRNGVPIAFAVMADAAKDISDVAAEAALDAVPAALAECACSSPTS
jgi:D-alanyl-D-alanine carboxypeptidase/D-alanyl-D-alanine-endopeptidase (penicillin-binding protein 4)